MCYVKNEVGKSRFLVKWSGWPNIAMSDSPTAGFPRTCLSPLLILGHFSVGSIAAHNRPCVPEIVENWEQIPQGLGDMMRLRQRPVLSNTYKILRFPQFFGYWCDVHFMSITVHTLGCSVCVSDFSSFGNILCETLVLSCTLSKNRYAIIARLPGIAGSLP